MSMYVAQISAGIVAQVTVEPDNFEPRLDQVVIGRDNTVGIGWSWDGTFSPPEPRPEEIGD